jgi:hypothetical protein
MAHLRCIVCVGMYQYVQNFGIHIFVWMLSEFFQMQICMHVCMYACICMYRTHSGLIHMHVYTYMCMYACTYMYVYVCMYTHVCVCTVRTAVCDNVKKM